VGSVDCLGERFLVMGNGYQVDVVGHEAVAEQVDSTASCLALEQVEVDGPVIVDEEDLLTVIAALGDVVRETRDDDASGSWHGGSVPREELEENR
jgi:uncharacterized protein with ACT and thioredoxin-like domain